MSANPENDGDETAGEAELAALDLANLTCNEEGTTAAAVEEPGDDIDGWTPPPKEECPVCFLPLPIDRWLSTYMSCCGKVICSGCVVEMNRSCKRTDRAGRRCPFCRTPAPKSTEEAIARVEARIKKNDPDAMLDLGVKYLLGRGGLTKDDRKGMDLVCRAAELGLPAANYALGYIYSSGEYVAKDFEEAGRFYKIAADKGDYRARCGLGRLEEKRGNVSAAMKHYKISASAGVQDSVDALKDGYKNGHINKEEFAACLRAFQAAQDEMKSESRERFERRNQE